MSYLAKPDNADVFRNIWNTQAKLLYSLTENTGTALVNLGSSGVGTWNGVLVDSPAWGTLTAEGPYVRLIDIADRINYGRKSVV